MADSSYIKPHLLHSSSSSSLLSLPLTLYPLHIFPLTRSSLFKRRLSLSKLSSNANSPKLHLIYTSERPDGSLLFKFGDESEIPEEVVERLDVSRVASFEEGEIEVELERVSEINLDDTVISKIEHINDVVHDDIDVKSSDTASLLSNNAGKNEELESGNDSSVPDVENKDQIKVGDELKEIPEESSDSVEGKHDHSDIIQKLELGDFGDSEIVTDDSVDVVTEQVTEVSKVVDVISEGDVSDVENLDGEVTLEHIKSDVSLKDEVSNQDEGEEDMVELVELPPVQLEGELILDEEVDDATSPISLLSEDSGMTLAEASLDSNSMADVETPTALLKMSQAAVSSSIPSEVNDPGSPWSTGLGDNLCGSDVSDPAFPGSATSGTTSTPSIPDSSYNGDISTSTLVAASLPHPSKATDATPSTVLQSDDYAYGRDVFEIAGLGTESSGTGWTESAETSLDSLETSTFALSIPSAAASLPNALEVNDVAVPTILQPDNDASSGASVAAGPVPETSEISVEGPDLSPLPSQLRVEISSPLYLASAAASLSHSSEVLAGGDDAYFICKNWFGVADGVGQWSFGGIHKGLYAQELMQNCEKLAQKSEITGLIRVKELLQQSATKTEAAGSARVLLGHVTGGALHVANIGDSGFFIIRDGIVFQKSSPMFHEFNFPYAISPDDDTVEAVEEYHASLEDGDIIVTATDGLFDNLYEQEIASLVSKGVEDGKNVKALAELLATKAQEIGSSPSARTPFADAVRAAGHFGVTGGKFDHVTVIVSAVQKG